MPKQILQKKTMRNGDKTVLFFTAYFSLAAVEALVALAYTLLIPGDTKNNLFLGYSLPRLVIAGSLILAGWLSLALACQSRKKDFRNSPTWTRFFTTPRPEEILILLAAIIFLASFTIVFTPGYRFGRFSAYLERLFPVLVWLLLVSFQTLLAVLILRFGWHGASLKEMLKMNRQIFLASAVGLGVMLVLWIIMAVTRVGIQPDQLHWYDNGVPILMGQVMLACGITSLVLFLFRHVRSNSLWFDVLPFLLIWLVAVLIWYFQPQQSSYFAPGPYPPNNEFYPYSDAVRYDVAAQNALMGSGYNNLVCPDKPLLLAFLTWMHLMGGISQQGAIFWQVVFLATLPAVVYLLGKELHSRAAGTLAAALVTAREANAILAATFISTSHSKLMLSEVPQTLMLALAVLFLIRWVKQPEKRTHNIILVGSILGFSILMRLNTLLLVPAALGIIPLALGWHWKSWLKPGLLLLVMAEVSLIPWMWRIDAVCHESPFIFISSPINISVIKYRYTTYPLPPAPAPTPQEGDKAAATPTPAPGKFDEMKSFLPAHFLHNLSANLMTLPLSLSHDDLYHTLKKSGSVWSKDQSWDGYLSTEASGLLFINLMLLSLSIGLACSRWKVARVVPLGLVLAYFLAVAGARTSGGRYLVPVDWTILFYYSLGLCQILVWVAQTLGYKRACATGDTAGQKDARSAAGHWRILPAVLLVLSVSVSIPLTERLFPPYESSVPFDATYNKILASSVGEKAGFSDQEINAFISQGGKVFSGRALYPRYFKWDEGMVDEEDIFSSRSYSRTAFILTGPRIPQVGVILPMELMPTQFPNGADVFVFGCETNQEMIDALLVVILQPELYAYTRSPAAPLACPLPEPVCDDNHVCH